MGHKTHLAPHTMKTSVFAVLLLLFSIPLVSQAHHPILRNFDAHVFDNKIRLSWMITAGNTCSGIRIQRSDNNLYFETIGEIDGVCGSPDTNIPYVFLDSMPLPGQINYYRLELGAQGFSKSLAIEYVPLNNKGFNLRYNQTGQLVTVYFENDGYDVVAYRLYSSSGQLITNNSTKRNSITFNISAFPRQIFLLRIDTDNRTFTVKVPGF